jgi:hypothetical protein
MVREQTGIFSSMMIAVVTTEKLLYKYPTSYTL